MSTHYGKMIHMDDRTVMFGSLEEAAEFIGDMLPPEVAKKAIKRSSNSLRSGSSSAHARAGGGPFSLICTRAADQRSSYRRSRQWRRN